MGCSYNDDTSITLLFFISWEGFIVSDLDINKQLLNVNLNSDFNTEASSHSLSSLSANQSPDFWSACQNLLHDNINLVCISNYNVTPENRINYYVFKIDTEQLTLLRFKDSFKREFVYVKNVHTISMDNQIQPKEALIDFVKQINSIGRDLRDKKALLFERTSSNKVS